MRLKTPSLPETGSQPRPMEKTMMSSGPSQKTGMLAPATAKKPAARSIPVPCRRAAVIPSGSEMSRATAIEANVSSAEAWVRSKMMADTALLWWSEVPRSPFSSPPMYSAY